MHHSRIDDEPNWTGLCDQFKKLENVNIGVFDASLFHLLHINFDSKTWIDNLWDLQLQTGWDNP